MSKIPTSLPAGFEAYAKSPEFTHETLPAKLQAAHTTKAGTWALLHVLEGKMIYQLEAPNDEALQLNAGENVIIEENIAHSVKFIEPGRCYVEFFRLRS